MNLNLITLNTKGKLDFDIDTNLEGFTDSRILQIDNINSKGVIIDNGTDDYEVNMHITGCITLKSSINNSPVKYKIDIKYDDFITDLVQIYKNGSNSLDILPIIWENILLEIPIRATNPDDVYEQTEGVGWEIL